MKTATGGTYIDINVPYCFNQFSHGHSRISGLKLLKTLKLEYQFQFLFLCPVVQKSIITYFLKSAWQDMHEETANKLLIVKCDFPVWFTWPLTSCRKGCMYFCSSKDAVVRNSDFIRISSKIFDRITKTIKGLFDIGTPVFLIKRVPELAPFIGITETFAGRRENKTFAFVKRIKQGKIFPLELVAELIYRNKKGG